MPGAGVIEGCELLRVVLGIKPRFTGRAVGDIYNICMCMYIYNFNTELKRPLPLQLEEGFSTREKRDVSRVLEGPGGPGVLTYP